MKFKIFQKSALENIFRRNLTILIKSLRGVLIYLLEHLCFLERRISFSNRTKNDPTTQEIVQIVRGKMLQSHRPAHETFLDGVDVIRMLQISRRKLQYFKSRGTIVQYKCGPKGRRTYYLLSNILDILKRNRTGGDISKF